MKYLPKLKPGQDWCCGEGCGGGGCTPVPVLRPFKVEARVDGTVQMDMQLEYVSACCHGDLMLYDHEIDDYVPWEYVIDTEPFDPWGMELL